VVRQDTGITTPPVPRWSRIDERVGILPRNTLQEFVERVLPFPRGAYDGQVTENDQVDDGSVMETIIDGHGHGNPQRQATAPFPDRGFSSRRILSDAPEPNIPTGATPRQEWFVALLTHHQCHRRPWLDDGHVQPQFLPQPSAQRREPIVFAVHQVDALQVRARGLPALRVGEEFVLVRRGRSSC